MTARRPLVILDALCDPKLFGPWFKDPATWAAWHAFLAALFAQSMTPDQLAIYQACTGRTAPPTAASSEAWLICGRRAGKSFMMALIAVFLACFRSYAQFLTPGERATIMVIAADRKQARVIIRYVRALLNDVPMLKRLIQNETAESLDLTTRVTIEITAASYRAVRGYTIAAAILDEIAFFRTDDSANPDYEIIDAIRPAQATIPGAMMLCASSPYARRGALHDAYKRYWGKDDAAPLVWKAPTRTMNPSVPQRVIDAAYERDAARATAEYGAEFRSDIESFLTREAVEACVSPGVLERAPLNTISYQAFVDPSGGSSDSMTLGISHQEMHNGKRVAVLDALRESKPPFKPENVVEEFATLLKSYRVHAVKGDRYAGEWPREQFRKRNIDYVPAGKPKSDIYLELLPHINSAGVDLLDLPRLTNQLVTLERRTARGGKDSVDHGPGAHDDVANAVAGAIWLIHGTPALTVTQPIIVTAPWGGGFENNAHY